MIPKETVDLIIETARIEEVVGDFVSLKKRGVNMLGHCPFHTEKTPSFTVSPAKGIYKCFGCGKAGDSVKFVMEHESYTYPEALRYIAEKYRIEIVEEKPSEEQIQKQDEKESLYVVTSFAQKFYSDKLFNAEEGKAIGLSYFHERGFSDATIQKFQLGYALNQWSAFTDDAKQNAFTDDILEKAGLTIRKEKQSSAEGTSTAATPSLEERAGERLYDRFRNRVIFPVHNLTGRVIAFGARILITDPKSPKYVNSPETEIYHKSKSLYGIFFARKEIIKQDVCFLVEGYTDVISLHQNGIENVVASSGTSLTQEQIRLISRFTKNITILYDGDAAGIKASLRGIDLILEEGMNVKVVLFPDGDDPDSYSKKVSTTELKNYIQTNAKDFIGFKTDLLLKEVGNDPVRKAGLIKDIVASISKIPDGIIRSTYIRVCSAQMQIDEQVLVNEMNKLRRAQFKKQETEDSSNNAVTELLDATINPEQPETIESSTYHQEKEIVRLLLNFGDSNIYIEENVEEEKQLVAYRVKDFIIHELLSDEIVFENKELEIIINDIKNENPENYNYYFTNHTIEEIKNIAVTLMTEKNYLSEKWIEKSIYVKSEEEVLKHSVMSVIFRIKIKKLILLINENQKVMIPISQTNSDVDDLQELHIKLNDLRITLLKYFETVYI